MTRQEQFNTMVLHLRTQGVKSMGEDGKCLYRGPNGTMCAVGCLIPDDMYDPSYENQPSNTVIRDRGLSIDIPLTNMMQGIHDNFSVEDWEDGFKKTAKVHNLIYTK